MWFTMNIHFIFNRVLYILVKEYVPAAFETRSLGQADRQGEQVKVVRGVRALGVRHGVFRCEHVRVSGI